MNKLFVMSAALMATGLASAQGQMQPGQWEYKMKMEMPGMPFAMPPQSFAQCLTAKDVEQGSIARSPDQDGKCEIKNLKQDGSKVSYDMVCKGDHPMKAHADFAVTATTLAGVTTVDMQGQSMKQTFDAKRVGDCAKK